jgi:hypothetical protein
MVVLALPIKRIVAERYDLFSAVEGIGSQPLPDDRRLGLVSPWFGSPSSG